MYQAIRIAFIVICIVRSSIAIETIDEIIVESTKIPTPLNMVNSSLEILTSQDLEDSGAEFLSEVLTSLPGVHISQTGSFGGATSIYLRGGKPKHSLILLDGIPLNDSLDANGYDLAHFDINGIERVEVLKGPYSSLYGSGALSGVINIISKKGYNNPKKSIQIEKGSFDSTKLGVSIYEGTPSNYLNINASTFRSDGFSHASTYTPGSGLDDDQIENDNVHINTGGIINNGNEWNLSYRNIDTLAEYDPDGRWNTGDPGSYERKQEILYGNFKQNIKDDKLSLNYSLSHKKLDLLYPDYFTGTYNTGDYQLLTQTTLFKWSGIYKVSDDENILFGFEDLGEKINKSSYLSGADEIKFKSYLVAYQKDLNDKFSYMISTRTDDHNLFDSAETYQGSAGLYLSKNTKLNTSIGTSFLAPSGFQLSRNRALDAENGNSFEIGLNHFIPKFNTDVDFTYFNNKFEDPIGWNGTNYVNYAESDIEGFEVGSTFDLSYEDYLRFSYTYIDTDSSDDDFNSRRPQHKANLKYFTKPTEKISISTFLSYVDKVSDKNFYDPSSSLYAGVPVILDEYFVVDSNIRYKHNEKVEYYLNIKNIFDEEYATVSGYNTQKFSIFSGIKINL